LDRTGRRVTAPGTTSAISRRPACSISPGAPVSPRRSRASPLPTVSPA
jgi:hypothetical protein